MKNIARSTFEGAKRTPLTDVTHGGHRGSDVPDSPISICGKPRACTDFWSRPNKPATLVGARYIPARSCCSKPSRAVGVELRRR